MIDVIDLSSDEETCVTVTKHVEKSKNHREKKPNSSNINIQPKKRIKLELHVDVKDDIPSNSRNNAAVNMDLRTESTSGSMSGSEKALNEFVAECLKVDNTAGMHQIMEKKLKKYYNLAKPEYRESVCLMKFLQSKIEEVKKKPDKVFIPIQEVVDDLKTHQLSKKRVNCSDSHIRKLCRALNLVLAKIKKEEEKEVNWDDEEDSSYLILQRYRARLIQIHKKIAQLEGLKDPTLKRKISLSVCQFPVVNKTIERYVNAKGQFPDYQDVLELIKKCYNDECLNVSQEAIQAEAKTAFLCIGEQLQKQRKNECWESLNPFLEDADIRDPAEQNPALKAVLDENHKNFGARIDECINKYVEKSVKESKEKKRASAGKTEDEKSKEGEDEEEENDIERDDDEEDKDEEDEDEEDTKSDDAESDCSIKELGVDPASDDSMGEEGVFAYCGPVSPPPAGEDCSTSLNTEALSILNDSSSESEQEDEEEECENQSSSRYKNHNNCNSTSVVNIISPKKLPEKNMKKQKRTESSPVKKPQLNSDDDDIITIDD